MGGYAAILQAQVAIAGTTDDRSAGEQPMPLTGACGCRFHQIEARVRAPTASLNRCQYLRCRARCECGRWFISYPVGYRAVLFIGVDRKRHVRAEDPKDSAVESEFVT
jgi:hypothetical protein